MTAQLDPVAGGVGRASAIVENVFLGEGHLEGGPSARGKATELVAPPVEAPPHLLAVRSRAISLVLLAVVFAVLLRGAMAAYWAFTDAFVAPIILSPSNDAVIQSKLTLSRVLSEREALEARLEQGRLALAADERALRLLRGLDPIQAGEAGAAREARDSSGRADHRRANLTVLDQQRAELEQALRGQERYVADLERDLASGLVRKADLERERSKLAQSKVAVLENQRDVLSSREQLASIGADVVRVNLEIFKLEADSNGRRAQQAADEEALVRLDGLLSQMRARPIYRATESNQNVAFVPYAQLEGVRPGASVHRCTVWGVFGCDEVGRVAEVLPGEVLNAEPWGGEARGQYALLELSDGTAARARSLRVRGPRAPSGAASVQLGAHGR